jgi:hypothetical protein
MSVARETTAASASWKFNGACVKPLLSVMYNESSNVRAIAVEREMAV